MVWNTTSAGARGQGFPISYFPFGADSLNEPIQKVRKGSASKTPVKMLMINPGSTSTKVSYFEDEANVYTASIFHDAPVLLRYPQQPEIVPQNTRATPHNGSCGLPRIF